LIPDDIARSPPRGEKKGASAIFRSQKRRLIIVVHILTINGARREIRVTRESGDRLDDVGIGKRCGGVREIAAAGEPVRLRGVRTTLAYDGGRARCP